MIKLSVSIIAKNEEKNLDRCLSSIIDVGEIIYVDCGSTDSSIEIAKKYTNKIFKREHTPNLNINKNFGFDKASGEWILSLDGDEEITPELFKEIKDVIYRDTQYSAFFIPRKNYYFGIWLKRGAQYPDYQLRLFKKEKGRFECRHIHERIKIDGKIGKLKNQMIHYTYDNISQYLSKFDRDSNFEARFLYEKGINVNFFNSVRWLIIKPCTRFIRRYFFKLGILDGIVGLFAALSDAAGFIIRYFKLWEIYKNEKRS